MSAKLADDSDRKSRSQHRVHFVASFLGFIPPSGTGSFELRVREDLMSVGGPWNGVIFLGRWMLWGVNTAGSS